MTQLNVSYDEVEEIFAMWSEKFREDPDPWTAPDCGGDDILYGESCAAYFIKLLSEVKGDDFNEVEK